jgi:peptide/nickel transport system substrate-binding protein
VLTRRDLLAGPAASALTGTLARPALARGDANLLRFVPAAAYSSPDPIWTTAIVVGIHAMMVWDTPYGIDINLQPRPQMCAGHQIGDDGLTWTFALRDGLSFHDGEPVLGRDVVASIKRWGQRDTFGQRLLAIATEIDAPGDKIFRIRLTETFPQMLYALGAQGCYIMPERMAVTPASQPIKEYIGSGPFRFVTDEWVSGVRAVYARNDRYQPRQEPPDNLAGGKVVHFERVEWSIQPDPGTAASALMSGEVDWIDQPLFDLLPVLKHAPNVTIDEDDPFGLIGTIILNHTQPPFDNKKLRQALLPAIDQKEYIAAVLGEQTDYARLPVGYFTVGSPFASDAGIETLTGPRDFAMAKRLVSESGYKGESVLLMSPSDQPQMHAMAAVTESIFKKVGINVQVVEVDWGTLLTRRAVTKPSNEGGWNAFNTRIAGLGGANPSSAQLRGNGAKAWFGWPTAPEIERLREAWFHAPTLADQQRIAREMQLAAFEAVPYIPLGQWSQPTAHRADLTGFVKASTHVFWGVRRA